MGHHIDDQGRFQSDRHPDLPPDKVVLSFHDPNAWAALRELANWYAVSGDDVEFAHDIRERLRTVVCEMKKEGD